MSQAGHWLDWTRTDLSDTEAEELVASQTPDQRDHLAKEDFVWIRGTGVLFRDPLGKHRRARFTHGTHFRTRHGEFYVESGGEAKRVAPAANRARSRESTPPASRRE
jgi:hypothetical protein